MGFLGRFGFLPLKVSRVGDFLGLIQQQWVFCGVSIDFEFMVAEDGLAMVGGEGGSCVERRRKRT